MGVMTLTNFLADLNTGTGRTLDSTYATRVINNSYRKVAYAFQFHQMEANATLTTVAGTASYAVATDFRALKDSSFRITTPVANIGVLRKESRQNYNRQLLDVTSTANRGVPTRYHKYGLLIFLRPIPDAVYTIPYDYWKKITALSGGSDVTVLTDEWDEIIYLGALYRVFRDYTEHDRYLTIYNDYLGMIRSTSMEEDLEEFETGGLNIVSDDADIDRGIP